MKINKFQRYARNLSEENRFLVFILTTISVLLIFWDLLGWQISLLLSWVIGSLVYLILSHTLILTADGEFTKRKNSKLKPGRRILIVMIALVTFLSTLGVGVLLDSRINNRKDIVDHIFPFSLSVLAIFLSWLMITTKFAIHYCRLFYDAEDKNGIPYEGGMHGGLIFPGTDLPCYLDFFYLAFTISLGYSVSDVNANKTFMRGVIIVQSIFSFIFFSTVFSIFLNTIISLV
ncbi:MAG: hypothetical protein RLZZ148_2024 [Cyanobacteriota bacterium]